MSENYFEGWDNSGAIGQETSNLSGLGWQAENQRKQQAFQGQQAQAQRAAEAQQAAANRNIEQQRIGLDQQRQNWTQQKFGLEWPYFTNLLNSYSATGGGGAYNPGNVPAIDTGGVYGPGRIDATVHADVAANDQKTLTDMRNENQRFSGRGYGVGSPLQLALNNASLSAGRATDQSIALNDRTRMEELDAKQKTAGQTLAEQQRSNIANEGYSYAKLGVERQNALMAALAGIG